jgi:putative transposase
MARPERHVAAGAYYHGMSRGVDRQLIYRVDDDYELFIHAYCLMPNHYHLVVETPLPNLPAGMKHLNGVYAQGFNRRYGRVGHLFEARYVSRVIEDETYLEVVTAYVVDNPKRAGLCERASDWAWRWAAFRYRL